MARSFGLDEIQVQNNILRRFTHIHMNTIVGYSSWHCVVLYHYRERVGMYIVAIAKMYVRTKNRVYVCEGLLVGLRRTAKAAPISTRPERPQTTTPSPSDVPSLFLSYYSQVLILSYRAYMAARRRVFWLI